ncbi:hypothetical protein EON65_53590 [archaeon]|nr:MAG: hypothetical protein EON65_53590 [archaeon]
MTTRTLDEINDWLKGAHHLLSVSDTHDSYTWLKIAGLIVDADINLRALQRTNPMLETPLLGEVLSLLRQATLSPKNKQEFLKHTKAARRTNPGIFTGIV